MPKVPVQQLQEVNARPLSQNRMSSAGATPDAFGASIGRGLISAAQGVDEAGHEAWKIVRENKERDQKRALLDVNTAWQAAKREKLYGTAEKPGYFATKGATAVEQAGLVDKDLEDMRQEFIKNLPDQEVALAFEQHSLSDLEESRGQIARHTMSERNTAEAATRQSAYNEARQAVMADPANPAVLGDAMTVAVAAAEEQAAADGFKPTDVAWLSAVEKARTGILEGAITSLAQTDATAANELFLKTGHLIDGDVKAEIKKNLETVGMAEFAQSAVDHVMSLPGMSDAQRRQYLRDSLSGKKEDEAIKELQSRINEIYGDETRAHLQEQRAVTALDREIRLKELQDGRTYDATAEEAMQAMNTGTTWNEWSRANPAKALILQQRSIEPFEKAEANWASGQAHAPVTDGKTYAELMKRNTTDLANTPLNQYQPYLTMDEFTKLEKAVKGAQATVDRQQNSLAPLMKDYLKQFAPRSYGFNKKDPDPTQVAKQNYILNEANAWLMDQTNGNKVPSREDIMAKAQELSIEAVKENHWTRNEEGGSFKGPVAMAKRDLPKEDWKFVIVKAETMPKPFRDKIEQMARNAGLDPTNIQMLEELAGAYAMNDGARMDEIEKQYGQ